MLLLLGALSLYSCQDPSRGTGIVTIDPDGGDGGDDVRIPDYPDDYSEIASWGDRGKWNLANVHDPVAAYCDGRYSGVGHCAVVNFGGKDYMFMHGYDGEHDYRSKLLIREIRWTPDGWPVIEL